MKAIFYKVDGCIEIDGIWTDAWVMEDDCFRGYVNDEFYAGDHDIYKIPKKIAEKLWDNPEKDIPKAYFNHDDKYYSLEDIEGVKRYDDVTWEFQISNKIDPSYYYLEGMPYAEEYKSEEEFFEDFGNENIVLACEDNNLNIITLSNLDRESLELTFVSSLDDFDIWRDNDGVQYKVYSEFLKGIRYFIIEKN